MATKLLLMHFLILTSSIFKAFADLPPEIEKCKSSDNDKCIAKNILNILHLHPHGYPEIGLPEVSSIVIKDVVLSESNRESPIQLSCKFNTMIIKDLNKLEVLRSHGFNKNLTKTVELDFFHPKVYIDGDYEMKGKLLLLPLNGKGNGSIILEDLLSKYKIKFKLQNRNNTNYAVIEKLKLWVLEPKNIIFNLQNIVNSNEALTESLNAVINENWSDLWKELQGNTIKIVEGQVRDVLEEILKVLPVDELYTD